MTGEPRWLPSMLALSGTWKEIVTRLYAIFEKDFKQNRPNFQHYVVWWDRRILSGQCYEEGFWHLISRDDHSTGTRLPDFRRAERLPWCSPTITHSDDNAVTVWDYQEARGRLHTYVWLEDSDYCIILRKLKRVTQPAAMLITAFHIDGSSRRRSLRNKHARRES